MNREQIINNMCMTWRHDYGLLEESEQKALFSSMSQIFDNDIKKELMMQHEVDEFEEINGELEEKICTLEKEKEKEKEKLEKEVEYWKLSFNKQVQSSRGGYQPIKNHGGEPLSPPKAE